VDVSSSSGTLNGSSWSWEKQTYLFINSYGNFSQVCETYTPPNVQTPATSLGYVTILLLRFLKLS
jgi:hypothetical protein